MEIINNLMVLKRVQPVASIRSWCMICQALDSRVRALTGNSIGYTGPSGMFGSNEDIFIDPTHCYYSDPCASSASYMKFVDINFKGPTDPTGATGITGSSQYFAQQIINSDQYNGFRFPMSNFTLTCNQQIPSQSEGPLFCPALQ